MLASPIAKPFPQFTPFFCIVIGLKNTIQNKIPQRNEVLQVLQISSVAWEKTSIRTSNLKGSCWLEALLFQRLGSLLVLFGRLGLSVVF